MRASDAAVRLSSRADAKSGERTPTPAMMSGLTDELRTLERLYDEVMEQSGKDELTRKMDRLLAAMQRQR